VPPIGTGIQIDPVNNEVDGLPVVPTIDLPRNFDLNFPSDVIAFSIDPTLDTNNVRWRAIFELAP
jgi:hypothetical protein